MSRMGYVSLLCCLLLALPGCEKPRQSGQPSANSQPDAAQTSASPATGSPGEQAAGGAADAGGKPKVDACTLLTSAEIQAVQGEPVKETKTDGRVSGGMSVSQCFYSVATFSKSVSLSVTQGDPSSGNPNGLRDFWKRTFHREGERERDREREEKREREKEREREMEKRGEKESEEQKKREREEEEEEGAPPKPVKGIGEEAFWMGSRVGGALYVLKQNSFLRISVGGPGNEEEKINKSKTLAQKALQRL